MKYFKLFNEQENLQYKDGLNTDTNPFDNNPENSSGVGLYFSDAENIMDFFGSDSYYIRKVEVPEVELVIKDSDDNEWWAHSLYLHERRSLYEAETWTWLKEQGVNLFPALMGAVRNKHTEIVQMLIDAGANPYVTDRYGRTALWTAYRKNYIKIALLLINDRTNQN